MTADIIAPAVAAVILVTALVKRKDLTGAFCEGAREGLVSAYELCPMLILLITAVTMFTSSGAAEALSRLLAPVANALGFPPECAPCRAAVRWQCSIRYWRPILPILSPRELLL